MKTEKMKHHFGQWVSNNKFDLLFVSILLICLIVVVILIHDYGASYDEPILYEYANHLPSTYIKAAFNQPISGIFSIGDKFVRYYGTSYLILGEFASKILANFHSLNLFNRWHILNFSIFLIGTYGIYWLCKKFAGKTPAFIAGLLYLTQPLLWGHGVMNPKDTPFASLFIVTIATGIKMVDLIGTRFESKSPGKEIYNFFIKKWYGKIFGSITAILFLDRLFSNFISAPLVSNFIQQIINHHESSAIAFWFYSKAQKLELQPEQYIQKFLSQVNLIEFVVIFILILIVFYVFLINSSSYHRWLAFSGIILGLTISVRTLGPAAGFLVILYWVMKKKKGYAITPLIVYIIIAGIISYISWPFLWDYPIKNFVDSFKIMANFPWSGTIRFDGADWEATSLPWYYLPKLLSIQLTIPSLLLLISGTVLTIKKILRQKSKTDLLIPILWFWMPLIGWMLFRPTTYDNFRQFLFIIPPIFILASIGIEEIIQKTQNIKIRWLSLLLIIPGIITGVLLHPYEYIYYNGFVGWTQSIERKFESDYWNTGFCEAGKYLDSIVSSNSEVAITNEGIGIILLSCMNNQPITIAEREEVSKIDPDFSIISTRWDDDVDYFRWMTPIHTISIGKTELLVIKQK